MPSRTVCVSASVNLPLHHKVQKFPSDTGSSGWSQKKDRKMAVEYTRTILDRLLHCTIYNVHASANLCISLYWINQNNILNNKGRTIQPKLDRTDPVKSAVTESAVKYWSNTDSDLQWTVRKYMSISKQKCKTMQAPTTCTHHHPAALHRAQFTLYPSMSAGFGYTSPLVAACGAALRASSVFAANCTAALLGTVGLTAVSVVACWLLCQLLIINWFSRFYRQIRM